MSDEGGDDEAEQGVVRARLPGWTEWRCIEPRRCGDDQSSDHARRASEELGTYLLASLQMQNLLVLSGLGTSRYVDGPDMSELWTACVPNEPELASVFERLHYGQSEDEHNIETLLSRCDAWLQVRTDDEDVRKFRSEAVAKILELCRRPGASSKPLDAHRELLRRLARRRARDPRLQLFTTNYDRCFEAAAGTLGLVVVDGFSFSHPRRFDPRYFDYDVVSRNAGKDEALTFVPGLLRYYKLHGSVDWRLDAGGVVIDQDVAASDVALIYPASTKFRVSYQQPHLELTAHYLAALRQPNSCILVLGFGFNDEHLSQPIVSALESNPHLRSVVVSPDAEERMSTQDHPVWKKLTGLASGGTDVAFVGTTFEQFVRYIPDLRALSPAEKLARAVATVKE